MAHLAAPDVKFRSEILEIVVGDDVCELTDLFLCIRSSLGYSRGLFNIDFDY